MSTLLLETAEELAQKKTAIWISVGAIVLLALVIVLLSFKNKKADTRSIAFAGVCTAMSFALSFAKIPIGAFGGSVTVASLVPLLIYAFAFGPIKGLMAGVIFGLLQFVQDPYIFTPLSFALDYILPNAGIAFAGLTGYWFKKPRTALCLGATFCYVWKFAMHFFSGLLYFNAGWIVDGLPATNGWIYSFVYQCTYVPADMAICLAVIVPIACTPALKRIMSVLRPQKEEKPTEEKAENQA